LFQQVFFNAIICLSEIRIYWLEYGSLLSYIFAIKNLPKEILYLTYKLNIVFRKLGRKFN